MESQPGIAAKDEHVAGIETKRAGRVAALRPAYSEQTGIAER